jgi:hypothetical protein
MAAWHCSVLGCDTTAQFRPPFGNMETHLSTPDPLDDALVAQLRASPRLWTEVNLEEMPSIDGDAIGLLAKAGLLEGRYTLTVEIDDLSEQLRLGLVMFGEVTGMEDILPQLFPAIPTHWLEEERKFRYRSRWTFSGIQAIRRTDQAELAIKDLSESPSIFLDFVRRRRFFHFRPQVKPKVRIVSREHVKAQSSPGPNATAHAEANIGDVTVNVSNHFDLNGLTDALKSLLTPTPTTGAKKTGRPKATEKSSATKVLAALVKWHGYEAGSISNDEPASVAELKRLSGTSDATVSRALLHLFSVKKAGYRVYEVACRSRRLGAILMKLLGEDPSYLSYQEDE